MLDRKPCYRRTVLKEERLYTMPILGQKKFRNVITQYMNDPLLSFGGWPKTFTIFFPFFPHWIMEISTARQRKKTICFSRK